MTTKITSAIDSTTRAMARMRAARGGGSSGKDSVKDGTKDTRGNLLTRITTRSGSKERRQRRVSALDEEQDEEPDEEDGTNDEEGKNATATATAATIAVVAVETEVVNDNHLYTIPDEYKKHQQDTEPMLHYLTLISEEEEALSTLLQAAQKDIRLHQARIKASIKNEVSLVKEYSVHSDHIYQERLQRKESRLVTYTSLQKDAKLILLELEDDKKALLTQAERIQVKLARWQRALELYVYCPKQVHLDLLGLLEKLLEGTSEVKLSVAPNMDRKPTSHTCILTLTLTFTYSYNVIAGRRTITSPFSSLSHVPNIG